MNNHLSTGLISQLQLAQLKTQAQQSPRYRERLCLHASPTDPVQEMVIALAQPTYIPPHRQLNKRKSYLLIEGELAVVFFDNTGRLIHTVRMGTVESGLNFLYSFSAEVWHTAFPLTAVAVYLETIAGPYQPRQTEFAPWSLDQADSAAAQQWLANLRLAVSPEA